MFNLGEIVQTIKSIIETRIEIIKSEIQDEFVGILSRLLLLFVMGAFILLIFLFLSLSMAFYISYESQSHFLGFLVVSLFYLLALLILFLTRHTHTIQNRIISALKGFIFREKIKKDNE